MKFIKNRLIEKFSFLFFLIISLMILGEQAFSLESITEPELPELKEIPVRQESVTIIKNDMVTNEKYKIAPGDVLSVSVYDEPDLLQPEIIVRPDGYATINPIGEVFAQGLSIEELTTVLETKFKEYLNYPKISVNIRDFNPLSVYIFGEVQKPGMYQQTAQSSRSIDTKEPAVKTDFSLMNVLSNAGGIKTTADISNISIRNSNNKERRIDLWKFIKDGNTSQNIKLQTGDTIYIPKAESISINDEDFELLTQMTLLPETFPVRVIGEVQRGGIYEVNGTSPYLNTAISSASGYTLDGKKSIVVVHRMVSDNKFSKIYVKPFKNDFVLRPNDLIEVKKRTFMKVVFGADYLSRLISPFMMIPNAGNAWADWFNPRRRYYRY